MEDYDMAMNALSYMFVNTAMNFRVPTGSIETGFLDQLINYRFLEEILHRGTGSKVKVE